MKPTIGILLDEKTFRKIPSARTGYEDLSLYTKAAKQLGLKPINPNAPAAPAPQQ